MSTAPARAPAPAARAKPEPSPQKTWPPAPPADSAGLDENDMIKFLLPAEELGSRINITAVNGLYDQGIPYIVTKLFDVHHQVRDLRDQTEQDRRRQSVEIGVKFNNVKIGRPTAPKYVTGKIVNLYPNEARLSGRTYSAPLSLSVEVTLKAHYEGGETATKVARVDPFPVARVPIMVGSNRCHTWNLPREARKRLKEDPSDPGGYFIAKGGEWVVEWLENIKFNTLHVHKNTAPRERVRGEFISQPGGAFENSSQLIIRYMKDGALTIELNNTKFSGTRMPFYLVFRLLGMTSDADIFQAIAYDVASAKPVTQQIVETVEKAFFLGGKEFAPVRHELDVAALVEFTAVLLASFVGNPTAYRKDDNSIRYLVSRLLEIMDADFLPHLGRDIADRPKKLRFLGTLIHKTLLVDMGIHKPTDRDSYTNKRAHGACVSLEKAFKTLFNIAVVRTTTRLVKGILATTAFEDIRPARIAAAVRKKVAESDLGRTLEQAITSGDSGKIVIGRHSLTNRVSSQILERKNAVNVLSAQRGISAHSSSSAAKQTQRADEMRRVHSSYPGYICIAKSADTGDKVGMKKGLALSASVCEPGQPFVLIERLAADSEIIPLVDVDTPQIARQGLSCVYVNGAWVGCVREPYNFVKRYRALRRESRVVDCRTSIVWDPNTSDVFFFLDVGRLIRPLLIVDSNVEEYKRRRRAGDADFAFVQTIRLTPAHVRGLEAGTLALEDLRRLGVFEWITPDEAESCLVAPDIAELRATAHNPTRQWTHCDIPQALMGVTALLSPYGNHTQLARVTYETNQGRQSGGWYCLAAPFRADKGRFFQHYIETPCVRTLTSGLISPCSLNTMIAYLLDDGLAQEDSGEIDFGFAKNCGFAGDYYTKVEGVLDKGEEFANPDVTRTKGLKPDASYEKLVDGVVPVGTAIKKGDVLIGRVAKAPRGPGGSAPEFAFVDRSLVYYHPEPATVAAVYRTRDSNDNPKIIVSIRFYREIQVGEKISSRSGNKMIAAITVDTADMPYTESGVTPDIIINTHSFPSRMTIGQMIEGTTSLLCQERGTIVDGTSYREVSLAEVFEGLEAEGARYCGMSRMFNGRTGEYYDAAIVIAPTASQRLLKFVDDDKYVAPGRGPTDTTTHQPLDGKNARGGIRVGEMEAWVLETHGAMAILTEKMFDHSDGQDLSVCRRCGRGAVYNARRGLYRCNRCRDNASITTVDSCHAAIVAMAEIRTAGIDISLVLQPLEFPA